jgi:hypothetical protein
VLTGYLGNYRELGEILPQIAEQLKTKREQTNQSNKTSAILQALRVDINPLFGEQTRQINYQTNVQRILNCMKYDKIEAYKNAKITRCTDGFIFEEERDFDITQGDDTGMCYELAIKTASWLSIMYPDNQYIIGEDKKRPSGWNHFFVVDESNNLIIDPSKDKIGKLDKTGQWDKTQINYKIDETGPIHQPIQTQKKIDTQIIKKDSQGHNWSRKLPIISPRHFQIETDIDPFGVCIEFNSLYQNPFICVSREGKKNVFCSLSSNLSTKKVYEYFKNYDIEIPIKIVERIVDMWQTIVQKGNFKTVDYTIKEYQKLKQNYHTKLNLL